MRRDAGFGGGRQPVLLVDHDTQVLREADWLIELGPEAAARGGRVIAQGTVADVCVGPAVADRAVSGRPRTGLSPPARAARRLRAGPNPPVRVRAPYGQAAHGGNPEGQAHGRDRRVRLGQDDAGFESLVPAPGAHRGDKAAGAYPVGRGRGHPAGQSDRRDADRGQRPLDRRDLCQRA